MKIEKRYPREFTILKENGQLVEDWSNVYQHCRLEGEIAEYLAKELKLSEQDTYDLVSAAILHDWFKRVERTTENYDTEHSYKGLQALGISDRVCDIAHSVGHTTLSWIENSTDLLRKVMHFIDDICSNIAITPIRERVETMRETGRYVKLEEEFRSQLEGRSFFDVQIEVGERIQNELEQIMGITQGTLVEDIKNYIQR